MKNYQTKIIDWANDRNLIKPENAPKQRLKLLEEVGETARAILKKDVLAQVDGIGDIFVVLIILAEQVGEEVRFTTSKTTNNNFDDTILFEISRLAFEDNFTYAVNWLDDLAISLGLTLEECVESAYNEIKNRTGKTINGTFIKD